MFNVLVPGTCSLLTRYIVVHDIDLFRTASFVVNKSDMKYIMFWVDVLLQGYLCYIMHNFLTRFLTPRSSESSWQQWWVNDQNPGLHITSSYNLINDVQQFLRYLVSLPPFASLNTQHTYGERVCNVFWKLFLPMGLQLLFLKACIQSTTIQRMWSIFYTIHYDTTHVIKHLYNTLRYNIWDQSFINTLRYNIWDHSFIQYTTIQHMGSLIYTIHYDTTYGINLL